MAQNALTKSMTVFEPLIDKFKENDKESKKPLSFVTENLSLIFEIIRQLIKITNLIILTKYSIIIIK
jgi:hypothetical protein